jgi:hypothetical protein
MAAPSEWVELTKVNGEIDAQLVAGGLANEDIETHLEKDPGVWRYGASDPFALVTLFVHRDHLDRARALLDETRSELYEFEDVPGPPEPPELPDPFIRNRSLRWWLAALVAGGLVLAMLNSAFSEVVF